jgi:hypothetical protein
MGFDLDEHVGEPDRSDKPWTWKCGAIQHLAKEFDISAAGRAWLVFRMYFLRSILACLALAAYLFFAF